MEGLVLGRTSAERLRRRRDADTPLGSTARDLRHRMASEAIYDSPLMSMTSKKLTHANTLHNPLRIRDGSPANFMPGIPKIYVPYAYTGTPKSEKAARTAPAKLNQKKSKAYGSKDAGRPRRRSAAGALAAWVECRRGGACSCSTFAMWYMGPLFSTRTHTQTVQCRLPGTSAHS